MVGYHLLFFGALKYTTATKASMINAVNPLITAFLASFFVNEKLNGKKIVLIIMAFLGVVLTIIDWDFSKIFNMSFNLGDLLMLLATICWAIYSVLVKKTMKNYTPIKLTTYTFLSCVIMLFPFAIKEIIFDNALMVGIKPYFAVLYMGIFPTVLGYTIQQVSIKEIGAGKTSLFINLVPVFSTLMAVAFLHETVKSVNIISGMMIITSVIIYSRINVK
jgi:drug/metabolite transporter (DMT)-like permease